MADWASLREAMFCKGVPTNTSIQELMQRYGVDSMRELIRRLTPDWNGVRSLFTEEDRLHMLYGTDESGPLPHPIDLYNYEDVRRNAQGIYQRVTTADEIERMPPHPAPRWSLDLTLVFRGWMAGAMRL